MIAVDTNILVYAHRTDSQWYERAGACVSELAEGPAPWGIPWPCVHEFFGIATHPCVFAPPSTELEALDQLDAWFASPTVALLGESRAHWPTMRTLIMNGRIVGPQVHDARIAAICLQHGVRELWTADRDFSRFPNLKTRNPLVG